jgi:hypothetical protein
METGPCGAHGEDCGDPPTTSTTSSTGGSGDEDGSNDLVKLTTQADCGEIGFHGYCYTGDQMKELYGWYSSHPGQWNNYDANNSFTTTDFLAWMLNAEIGYTLGDKDTLDVAKMLAAEKMMWLCGRFSSTNSCSSISENAIFNYIATRASAAIRFGTFHSGQAPDPSYLYYDSSNLMYAHQVAIYAVNYKGNGSMADWGNRSMFTNPNVQAQLNLATRGTRRNQYLITYGGPDPLYFLSSDQNLYWYCLDQGGSSC